MADCATPPLKPCDAAIARDFADCGMFRHGDAGMMPLSWEALHAWASLTRARLSGFEARILRMMSAGYVAELRAADNANPEPPYMGDANV